MDDSDTRKSAIRPMRDSTLLMFGIFAAPTAWALQLVASYALAAASCFSGGVATVGAASLDRMPLAILAIACALVAIAGLVVAMQRHRGVGATVQLSHPDRSRALATVGILSSLLFLGAIAFSIVMLSMAPHCAG